MTFNLLFSQVNLDFWKSYQKKKLELSQTESKIE